MQRINCFFKGNKYMDLKDETMTDKLMYIPNDDTQITPSVD